MGVSQLYEGHNALQVNAQIIMHDAASKGAINYLNLAREILQKNGLTRMADADKIINVTEQN